MVEVDDFCHCFLSARPKFDKGLRKVMVHYVSLRPKKKQGGFKLEHNTMQNNGLRIGDPNTFGRISLRHVFNVLGSLTEI